MYKITTRDGAVLYDVSYPDLYMVQEPVSTLEVGQPGSVQFSLVPEHSLYNSVKTMETYVRAFKENSEFFYGRVIDINIDKTTGIKQVECAGALQFLEDGEVSPIVAEQNQQQQQSGQQEQGVEMTASQFFARCISDYNNDIGNDAKRVLQVGTINHSKANATKKYNISNYTQAKSALETNLLGEYGGYFRVRRSGNSYVIDWLEEYGESHASPIRISENILNQENAITANDFFTVVRPLGANNITLTEVTVPISQSLVNKHGRIVRTVTFGDAETEEALRTKVNEYIEQLGKGVGRTATVKVIDLHFLDNSIPAIRLASTYTNVSGFEGEEMVIAGMELHFANPSEDTVTFKNRKELVDSRNGGASGKGSLAKAAQAASGPRGFQNIWKHISETEDSLSLHAKLISINAEHLVETATEFERYSRVTDETLQTMDGEIHQMEGTGVFQNNDQITQVAGSFSIKYYVVPDSKRQVPEINPSQHHWYICNQNYIVQEADIGSGKEFFSNPAAALAGTSLATKNLTEGQQVCQMVLTADTSVVETTVYYTKGIALGGGAEVTLTTEGQQINVGDMVGQVVDGVQTMQGSALWTQKDHITAVCGQYAIRTDPDTGEERLVVLSGGGLKIEENGTEFGLYETDDGKNGKLTAGIIVGKINDPNNPDKVLGTKVDILASQVRVGSTSNVQAWMNDAGIEFDRLDGLIADKATIADLQALRARISTLEADYVSSDAIESGTLNVNGLSALTVQSRNIECVGLDTTSLSASFINSYSFADFVINASKSSDGSTLTLTKGNGSVITFNKAASQSVSLSGAWSGGSFTVTTNPNVGRISTHLTNTGHWGVEANGEDPKKYYYETYASINNSGALYRTGNKTQIDASSIFDKGRTEGITVGYNQGTPISGTPGGTVANQVHNFTITRRTGNPVTIQIDCRSIYQLARQGYTYGTFIQATVPTLSAVKSVRPINTTATVRIGSATTLREPGSGKKYDRGTAYTVTKISTTAYSFSYERVYDSTGKSRGYYWIGQSGGQTLYGKGSTVTVYPGDGGEFVPQGAEVAAYKKLTSGGTVYYTAKDPMAYYEKGPDNTTDYYKKT